MASTLDTLVQLKKMVGDKTHTEVMDLYHELRKEHGCCEGNDLDAHMTAPIIKCVGKAPWQLATNMATSSNEARAASPTRRSTSPNRRSSSRRGGSNHPRPAVVETEEVREHKNSNRWKVSDTLVRCLLEYSRRDAR